jgi:sphinganine-1-phosphate aldolase
LAGLKFYAMKIPENGKPKESILAEMQAVRQRDVHWRSGKTFSLVFKAGDEVTALLKEAYTAFFSENGLNPSAFPSLRKFETEVVGMTGALLDGGDEVAGNMTSGGTESILMAVKTARDWARANRPEISAPEMVLPASAHPAFEKAAHYFDVKAVHIPLRSDFRADVEAVRKALTSQTVLLVGSAPSYPHGVVDPIAEMAGIAQEAGILFHVDACVGGFMLPFVRRLGYPAPDFDFQVPGVTSISADLHKYGYAAKGASVILYRDKALRRHQFFASTDWPGGIYASPAMGGTRPGGAIAAAWAIMNFLGEAGYLAIAAEVMKTTRVIQEGIAAMGGVEVLSNPEMSVFAIGSDEIDIYEVADEMSLRGWHLDRQQFPPSLHLTIHYGHSEVADAFLGDLAASVAKVRKSSWRKLGNSLTVSAARAAAEILPESLLSRLTSGAASLLGGKGAGLPQRSAAMYGMIGTLPNRGDMKELVLDLLDNLMTVQKED